MAIEPITRKEQFLAKAGGQQVRDLKPITREEMLLQKIAENGAAQPDLSQNDPDAADYVKGRTHYYRPYPYYGITTNEVNPEELGFGVYKLWTAENSYAYGLLLGYDNVKKTIPNGYFHSVVDTLLYGEYEKMETWHINLVKRLKLIDEKNYKHEINTAQGLVLYFIVDVSTLADEYTDMFTEPGVYLHVYEGTVPCTTRSVLFEICQSIMLDDMYFPSTIARTADVIPTPATATVGQTIVVKSVDENGKPTEWEAAKPGEKWELIKTLNFTEDTYSIDTIETDDNGNPFELTAYQVVSVSGAPSASQMFRINPHNNGRNVSSANAFCEPTWGTGDRGLFAQVRIEASRMLWYIMGNGMNLNLRWAALASGNITQISWSNFGSNYIKAGSVVEIWGIRA